MSDAFEKIIRGEQAEEETTAQKDIVESSMADIVKEKERGRARETMKKASEEVLRKQIEDVFQSAESQNKAEKEAEKRKKAAESIDWSKLAKEATEKKEEEDLLDL